MGNFEIITNNPAVVNAYPKLAKFYEIGVLEIFITVRDMVHKGAKVISHPLSGSIKPWESPYKSILVSQSPSGLDLESLKYIENAIGAMKGRRANSSVYTAEVLDDFRAIDLDLINSAIGQNNYMR